MSEVTIKKFMIVNRKAPYGTVSAPEALAVAPITGAFAQDVSPVFLYARVIQSLKGPRTQGHENNYFSPTYRVLEGYDIEKLYVEEEALAARGLSEDDLLVDVTVMPRAELGKLMDEMDVVLSF